MRFFLKWIPLSFSIPSGMPCYHRRDVRHRVGLQPSTGCFYHCEHIGLAWADLLHMKSIRLLSPYLYLVHCLLYCVLPTWPLDAVHVSQSWINSDMVSMVKSILQSQTYQYVASFPSWPEASWAHQTGNNSPSCCQSRSTFNFGSPIHLFVFVMLLISVTHRHLGIHRWGV